MRRFLSFVGLLFALVLLPFVDEAVAADRFVSRASGRDTTLIGTTNHCTDKSLPCRTINHAVGQSASGDTIKVTIAEYNENVSITPVAPLTLDLEGGWDRDFTERNIDSYMKSMIRAPKGKAMYIDVGGVDMDINISGFILTGGDAETGGGLDMWSRGPGGTKSLNLYSNIITGNHAIISGAGIRIWDHSSTLNLTLSKNIITDNHADGLGGGGLSVSTVFPDAVVTLTNNIIAGNSGGSGGGVDLRASGAGTMASTLMNNTIAGNTASIGGGGGLTVSSITNASATLNVTNSIIWGNRAAKNGNDVYIIEVDTSGDATTVANARYSDLGDIYLFGGTYNDNGGNVDVNPLFVDEAGDDYHLQADSVLIDSGICGTRRIKPVPVPTPIPLVSSLEPAAIILPNYMRIAPYDDFEGDPRPGFLVLSGCDIGADEYVPVNMHDEAIIDFGASGIWVRYNDTSWSKLHPSNPEGISMGDMDFSGQDEAIIDFGSSGIWVRYNDASWSKLHPSNPEGMTTGDMESNGNDEVIIDFGSSGIWVRRNDNSWTKLHPSNPDTIATGDMDNNGQDEVIIDFGSSGVWVRMNDTSWSKLHPSDPDSIAIGDMDSDPKDDVIVDFGASGIWVRMNNASWVKLHPSDPDSITTGDIDGSGTDDVIIDFGLSGIWVRMNNASWVKLHPSNPDGIYTGDMDGNGLDEVIIDFGSSGLWVRYNNTSWTKIHPGNCEAMATGNIDGH